MAEEHEDVVVVPGVLEVAVVEPEAIRVAVHVRDPVVVTDQPHSLVYDAPSIPPRAAPATL